MEIKSLEIIIAAESPLGTDKLERRRGSTTGIKLPKASVAVAANSSTEIGKKYNVTKNL